MVDMTKLLSTLLSRPTFTDEQRDKAWSKMQRHSVEVAEHLYHAGAVEESRCLVLQIDGGQCPRCKTDLEPVVVDNVFARGVRYRFLCRCFPFEHELEEDAGKATKTYINGTDVQRKVLVRCDARYQDGRCEEMFLIDRDARPGRFDGNGVPVYPKYFCHKHRSGSGRKTFNRTKLEEQD